ncbi:carbohydrate ABC transporter permease [Fimbriimonas ginsengisoli]|uniref:ABC transporter sugar permease n=1 Tax=Fimbriimonas ginsengisoli Gsoil 348 TaxID=661478 RepID=A0A068NS38_FIMGI|nr:carbohydrate ABC transporter permease [Fimbriimonas ginsengisoli]AIE86157.1 ABC transporter sugar permease [Fimbriimonas ginsengisoli Gsoil 348]
MKAPRREMWIVYTLLAFGAIVLALPFYYMLITSFKSMNEIAEPGMSMLVKKPTVQPYVDLLNDPSHLVVGATWNSFVIGIFATGGTMLLCTLAGYAFAKHRFPGKEAIFMVLLATMMIPGSVLLVPSFLLLRDFGWLDTWLPLIIPGLAGAFGVFLARQFMEKIPDSLIECAKIEGSGEWRIFFQIVLPLSKPLLATLGIMSFLGSWNSFLGPLIILLDEKKFTLPLVVAMLQGRFPGKDNMQMAGAMISILPVLILFFIFQRQIVQSLASSGLKEG